MRAIPFTPGEVSAVEATGAS